MNLTSSINIYAGGPGSGCNPQKGKCGRPTGKKGKQLTERQARAIASHIPTSPAIVQRAKRNEDEVAAALLGGKAMGDNHTFDVLVGKKIAVEVKSMFQGKNDKVTMHPECRQRKLTYEKKKGVRVFTVVLDERSGKRIVYAREGVGSFKLKNMTKVGDISKLGKVIK